MPASGSYLHDWLQAAMLGSRCSQQRNLKCWYIWVVLCCCGMA